MERGIECADAGGPVRRARPRDRPRRPLRRPGDTSRQRRDPADPCLIVQPLLVAVIVVLVAALTYLPTLVLGPVAVALAKVRRNAPVTSVEGGPSSPAIFTGGIWWNHPRRWRGGGRCRRRGRKRHATALNYAADALQLRFPGLVFTLVEAPQLARGQGDKHQAIPDGDSADGG